ncbi:MAG: hypothetical protein RLZZ111_1202 [Planctomycetota bacterium]|jgi:hypothetical protein
MRSRMRRRLHDRQAAQPPGPVAWLRSHWPTLVVAAYAVAAVSWTLPSEIFPPKPLLDRVAGGPLLFLGLWQSWDMFSPDPRTQDICVEVVCVDRDGTRRPWMLTDMIAMDYPERWRKDRWRKYFNDHLRLDAGRDLWQPFAAYAVRRLREEGHDPVRIELVRWWRDCEPAVRPELRADVRRSPWGSYRFFAAPVAPEMPR